MRLLLLFIGIYFLGGVIVDFDVFKSVMMSTGACVVVGIGMIIDKLEKK